MFLYSYIPFIIMMFSTVLIVKRLFKITSKLRYSKKMSCENINLEKRDSCDVQNNSVIETLKSDAICDQKNNKQTQVNFKRDKNSILEKRLQSYNQIYRLLLSLNIMFLVLVSPLVLCNYFHLLNNKVIRETVYLLAYLNHCLNSFIYGMSSENYRIILFGIFNKENKKIMISSARNTSTN